MSETKARVFISCGQATDAERKIAADVKRWFQRRGFQPYVAIQAQTLADVNSGIIDELKRADFYVFIDFRRELLVTGGAKRKTYRGSLFTNQELAIAFLLGFEHVVFLQQLGVERNGLLNYMGSNAEIFSRSDDVLPLIKKLVTARDWKRSYTRHLLLGNDAFWGGPFTYGDQTGQRNVRTFYVKIYNQRAELGALSSVARLEHIVRPDGAIDRKIDRSPLKATGSAQSYTQVIWPQSVATWDCLSVSIEEPPNIYLNSSLDVVPRKPIISEIGEHLLAYEVFAENFPVLKFGVKLIVSDNPHKTSATLVNVNKH